MYDIAGQPPLGQLRRLSAYEIPSGKEMSQI